MKLDRSICNDDLVVIIDRQWLDSWYQHSKIWLREPVAHMFVWEPLMYTY